MTTHSCRIVASTHQLKALAFLTVLFLPLFLANISRASGADLYVSLSGNDANPGTQAQPLRTIQKAANTAAAGSTVNIQSGTYSENVTINNSGTSSSRIVFQGTGSPVIGGNLTINGNYITVDSLTDSPPTAGGYNAVSINGQYDILSNCLVTNYGATAGDQATAIGIGGAYNTVQGCTVRDLNDIDALHVFGHDQIICNNYVTNLQEVNYNLNHTDFIQTWGNGSSSYNILVENNLVTNSSAQLGNTSNDGYSDLHDWTFRNNVFANIGNALFSGVPKTYFYNNVFYNVGNGQGYAISLYTQTNYSSVGDQIVNNIFLNNMQDVYFHNNNQGDVTLFSNNYFGGGTSGSPKTNGEPMGSNFINGGNPGLVNVAALDFHIQTGSVLINAGINLSSSFTTDKDGVTLSSTGSVGHWRLRTRLFLADSTGHHDPARQRYGNRRPDGDLHRRCLRQSCPDLPVAEKRS